MNKETLDLLDKYKELRRRTSMSAYEVNKIPREMKYISVEDMNERIKIEGQLKECLKDLDDTELTNLLQDDAFVDIANNELERRHGM